MGELNHDTLPLWEGWQRRELRFAHCGACGTWFHLPRRICPQCWSEEISFDEVRGTGRVISWSLPRQSPDQPVVITALVAMDDAGDVPFLARMVACEPAEMRFEMPVVVDWRDDGGVTYPQFRPSGATVAAPAGGAS